MSELLLYPPLIWAIAGVILLIIEMATFTFVFSFFAIGAFITAIAAWAGFAPDISSQLAVFAISSIAMLAVLRKTFKRLFAGKGEMESDIVGQHVKVIKTIEPGAEGAVEFKDSEWIAFSDVATPLQIGETVVIIGVDGIRLKVAR